MRELTKISRKEVGTMWWEFMVALTLTIPMIVFPAFLWYLDIGDRYAAMWEARKRRVAGREESTAVAEQRSVVGARGLK